MLPGEDSPVAPTAGIASVNSQQPAISDHPIDSFQNPFELHPIPLCRFKK